MKSRIQLYNPFEPNRVKTSATVVYYYRYVLCLVIVEIVVEGQDICLTGFLADLQASMHIAHEQVKSSWLYGRNIFLRLNKPSMAASPATLLS